MPIFMRPGRVLPHVVCCAGSAGCGQTCILPFVPAPSAQFNVALLPRQTHLVAVPSR